MSGKRDLGIYIHIPFCERKCAYCDFYSVPSAGVPEEYIDRLVREIGGFEAAGEYSVDSIFFGGGTPSLLSEVQAGRIFDAIYRRFAVAGDCEITLETNPNSGIVAPQFFNRISFGVQSANDGELAVLGRLHTWGDFLRTYDEARKFYDNISIDLMFGIPNQTLESWGETLEKVGRLGAEHLSLYSLSIEEGTPFAGMELDLPDEDVEREMYAMAVKMGGYGRYEISNLAVAGRECRHNLKYWNMGEYVGFGAGAHSFINGKRWENGVDWERRGVECDYWSEYMFLGLRQVAGVVVTDDVRERFGGMIRRQVEMGMMARDGGRVRLTERGIEVSNMILAEFV